MAVYLGERYSLEEFGKIFTQALCILLVGSILTYFVAPARVLDVSHTNAWRGLANHKNSFGECMALAVLLLLSIRFNAFRWLRIVLLIGAVGLLYLSHSSAAVAACAVVVAIMPMWRIVSAKRRNGWIVSILIGTMVVVCIALVTMNREMILTLLGHDSTLSGRVQLWEEVGKAILTHPILGYGYEAFWEGFKGVSRNILLETGWLVPMAHNGYLELMLSMGITGLLLFLVIFFRSFKLALHYVRSNSRPGALWPISFLCFFALHNLAESTLLTRQTFQFLVFAVILTSLLGQEWKEEADARCAASETRARSFNTLPNLATDRSVN
jgi:O-antigen ligase